MSVLPVALGLGWAGIAVMPLVVRARRMSVTARLPGPGRARRARPRVPTGPVGRVVVDVVARWRDRHGADDLDRQLPAALDLLVVAVESGSSARQAIEIAARWSPPVVAEPLRRVLVSTELGGSLADSLAELSVSAPPLAPVADVLSASARLGAPAAGALGRLAAESRSRARRRSEARARVLPVKLLFPLVFLVLPAFALLTVAPAVLSALSRL